MGSARVWTDTLGGVVCVAATHLEACLASFWRLRLFCPLLKVTGAGVDGCEDGVWTRKAETPAANDVTAVASAIGSSRTSPSSIVSSSTRFGGRMGAVACEPIDTVGIIEDVEGPVTEVADTKAEVAGG